MSKPILFSTSMVQAIIAGNKTMTRRVIKPQPPYGWFHEDEIEPLTHWWTEHDWDDDMMGWFPSYDKGLKQPYQPGDILWVRETWCNLWHLDSHDQIIEGTEAFYYAADGYNPTPFNHFPDADGYTGGRECPRWKPSIFMPKAACRIFIRVKNVRVERVQEISDDEARREGAWLLCYDAKTGEEKSDNRTLFKIIWNELNAKRGYGWDINPWVWVIEFERVDKPDGWPDVK